MKLNNEKNIKIYQQALFAKQLACYLKLCKTYESLAKIAIDRNRIKEQDDRTIAEQVSSLYGGYLTKAVNGDLSFLENDNNYIVFGNGSYKRFNDSQCKLIRNFSKYSTLIQQFKDAAQLLEEATHYVGENAVYFQIDTKKMNQYHDYMKRTSTLTKNFDEYISVSPRTAIARNSFKKTSQCIRAINAIDPEHITFSKDSRFFQERLTPKSFGANIIGVRSNLRRMSLNPKEKINSDFNKIYSKQEISEYKQKTSKSTQLAESIYVAGNKTKNFFKAHKGSLKVALMIAMLSAAGKHTYDAHIYNNLSVDTNSEKGFDILISKETQEQLSTIEKEIDSLKNISDLPSSQLLDSINNNLDSAITNVISDLMKKAIEKKYPNYSNIKVEDKYNLNINKNVGSSQPNSEEFIEVTAENEKGEEVHLRYDSFISTSIFDDPIRDSIENEEILDNVSYSKGKTTPGTKLREKINSIHSDATINTKTNNLDYITNEYTRILDELKHLAGCECDIIPFNYVLVSAPEKVNSIDEKNNQPVIVEDDYIDEK